MNKLQQEVGTWAEGVFTQATPATIVAHLRREVEELATASQGTPNAAELAEAADCLLLLFHLAHKRGYDLLEAARYKFAINRERQWGKPDAEGVVEHVREPA